MSDCIFCKIINGEEKTSKVYEDDQVIAILVNRPVRKGHMMIIPKIHIDHFTDLDDDLAMHICKVGNILARRILSTLKPKRVGFIVAGFGIAHVHYHVQPMWEEDDITSSQYATLSPEGDIEFSMDHLPVISDEERKELITLIREETKL